MYYDPKKFEFVEHLEANWRAIEHELSQLGSQDFIPYPEKISSSKRKQDGIFWYLFLGVKIDINCELCPETSRLVEAIPGMITAGFSRLAPGAHIVPHSGKPTNVLRCHLGLSVPEKCALRVASEIKQWVNGQCLVFDDTSEHEAWNLSDRPRDILLLDFKIPPGFEIRHDSK
ncbi:MAG: aspartyl/asparaginyl beta-hydroxylase domain-containing protein [Leptolyngbyaceae cyanobacterium CSU_1_3]|nr:aspartyl/asparaginyl beta-hydroxylase domain-containing protein [Leptolyngbyaceae cyanobacterium CSU_1_3]